jgi:putative aldouronate transport system substrate-binding protein
MRNIGIQRNAWKSIALASLSALMLTGSLVACSGELRQGSSAVPPVSTDTAGIIFEGDDFIALPVKLQCTMLGGAPKDMQLVLDKVNEITRAQLNCTVLWNFTSWSDTYTKYSLLLSSGEPIDLIYTSTWREFWKYAQQGAYRPLEKLLPQVAPELFAHVGPQAFKQATVNGHIMTVPSTYTEYITGGITYRADLSDIIPDSLENVEAYLLDVKTKHPEQKELTAEGPLSGFLSTSFTAMEALQGLKYKWVNAYAAGGIPYGLCADYATPSDINPYWGTLEFKADMKLMKKWYDLGFWDPFMDWMMPDVIDLGYIAMEMSYETPAKYAEHVRLAAANHPDWKIGYYSYALSSKHAIPVHPCTNGFAEPLACPNPERALLYLQMLVMDKDVNQLQQYGIRGIHYDVDINGYYVPLGDAEDSGFPREGMNGWGYRNDGYMLYPPSFDPVKAINRKLAPYAVMNILDGFVQDYTAYEGQSAALANVMKEYLAPLEGGYVENVDAAIETFMKEAKAAGLEDIQAAYIRQWKDYISRLGLR